MNRSSDATTLAERLLQEDRWAYELEAHRAGHRCVAGLDEAGRGPLAGPVVAAAIILPEDFDPEGIRDSKVLTPTRREAAFERIAGQCTFAVGIVGPEVIDEINILNATHRAAREALLALGVPVDLVFVDGRPMRGLPFPQKAIVDGDAKCLSVAAASIVAKVTRDRLMDDYDREFPGYGFSRHRGYCTPEHLEAIDRLGICVLHRKTFFPISRKVNLTCPLPGLEEV